MRITLISMDQIIISYGLRCISSYLKQNNFDVNLVFARCLIGYKMPADLIDSIIETCKGSDVVGLSLMSNHFPQSMILTAEIKKRLNVPVVWGGLHPTFAPDDCIKYADAICIGEGEESALEFFTKMRDNKDHFDTRGMWFSVDGKIIKNPMMPLISDLDKLPYLDYGPDKHFVRFGNRIMPMTSELFGRNLTHRKDDNGNYMTEYYISSSRGCPFKCSFCASNSIKQLYQGQQFYRFRSISKVVEEVNLIRKRFDFINWIYFADDDIFTAKEERTEEFCRLWKEKVKLPFYCTCSPFSYNEEKLKKLIDTGLKVVNMGIQSVSRNGGKSFNRIVPKERLLTAVKSIVKFKNEILYPVYDFILDNPYENDKDRLENLKFVFEIPLPRRLQLFTLVPFPGSDIYKRFKEDGLIIDEMKEIFENHYSFPKANYINLLFYLSSTRFPIGITKFLSNRVFLLLFNNKLVKYIFKSIPYEVYIWMIRNIFKRKFYKANRYFEE